MKTPYKILFLCTGNSARSIMAEYLMKQMGKNRFAPFSAGSRPTGKVNPLAIQTLQTLARIDATGARSKSLDEFKSVPVDFVITVCDNAREACPVWPGHPITAHWGFADPAAIQGSEAEKSEAFGRVFLQIKRRLELFLALPIESLDSMKASAAVREIGSPDTIAAVSSSRA